MRIHSNTITREDMARAASMARVTILQCDSQRSRKRSQAFELTLGGLSKSRTQRFPSERAATYRQWGTFLAELFSVDAEMIAGNYKGLADFDAQTRYAFDAVPYTTEGDDRVALIFRDKVTTDVTTNGVRIVSCERMRSSANGNPRFRVTLSNGETYPTAPDAMLSYGIEGRDYQEKDCAVTVNRRGWLVGIRVTTQV